MTLTLCPHAEPLPEEKLQKLHTDIKFALKVDNPVSDIYEFDTVSHVSVFIPAIIKQ